MGDSNGGPGLDRYAAEFSPNNDLNWRNNSVRDPLKNWMLTPHVNQFGYYSGVGVLITGSSANASNYSGTGSVYQINRNTRMVLKQQIDGTIATSSMYDNYYVQKPIPATDLRYSWITASVQKIYPAGFGYWPKEFYAPSLTDAFLKPVEFVSSSQLNLKTDFVGMNNYVYEPIPEIYTSAIKFSAPKASKGPTRDPVLIVSTRNAEEADSFNYQDILSYRNGNLGTIGKIKLLNALNLHRNGPYQHPSWKQSRTGQHKISRYLRRRNFIGCTQDRYLVRPGPNSTSELVTVENTYTTFYYEPAVQKVSIPFKWTLGIIDSGPSSGDAEKCGASGAPPAGAGGGPKSGPLAVTLGASLINAYGFVSSELANCAKGIKTIDKLMPPDEAGTEFRSDKRPQPPEYPHDESCLKESTAYSKIAGTYLGVGLASPASPVDTFVEAVFEAPTFPAPANKFSAENRERTNYSNTYYNSSRAARSSMGNKKFTNGDD